MLGARVPTADSSSTQGWFAIRRELNWLMAAFVFINVLYLVAWGGMFDAQVFAWTFVEWPFFACTTTASLLVQLGALVFAVICWRGFGRGLAHYLHVEQVLLESDFDADVFATEDVEKKGGSAGGVPSPIQRAPSALSELSAEGGLNVLVKDRNWDFADVDRPAIYEIEVQTSKRSLGSGSSDSLS